MASKNTKQEKPVTTVTEDVVEEVPVETEVEKSPEEKIEETIPTVAVVNCNRLNIRNKASKSVGEILFVATLGQKLDVLDNSLGDWVKVSFGSTIGFCMREFVDLG